MLLFHLMIRLGNLCVARKASGLLSLWLFGRWPHLDHMGNLANQVRFLCSRAAARISSQCFRDGSSESQLPDSPAKGEGLRWSP